MARIHEDDAGATADGRQVSARYPARGGRLALRASCSAEGMSVRLVDGVRTHAASIRVAPPATLIPRAAADGERTTWGMAAGLPVALDRHDVLSTLLAFGLRSLARHAGEAARLRRHLAALAAALARRCQPGARRIALRFAPPVRFRVYERLAGDPTGRLAQLALVCPGALLFAFALMDGAGMLHGRRRSCAPIGERLLVMVVEGERLNRVLDVALEGWAALAPNVADPVPLTWLRFGDRSPATLAVIRAEMRVLIRRAGPCVAPWDLWGPPPAPFAAEDIPSDPTANARWYRVFQCFLDVLYHHDDLELPARLAPFFSRHALECSRRLVGRGRGPTHHGTRLGELVTFLVKTGRVPTRHTDPRRLLADLDEWLAERARRRQALPPPPWPDWSNRTLVVRAIRSERDLRREGREMRHCVAQHTASVRDGTAHVFSVRLAGRRLTAEIVRQRRRWVFAEVRGRANRAPTDAEWRALSQWLNSRPARPPIAALESA